MVRTTTKMMDTMGKDIKTSSWGSGKYDLFFYGLIRGLRPKKCVELGTYAGYSAYCFALALSHNGVGSLDCYDLWDDYKYNHVSKAEAERNLRDLPVTLHKEDYATVHSHYKPSSVDFLMVDVSNDGDTYRKVLRAWKDIITPNGIIIFEGGTEDRDKWDWMIRYYKVPIANALNDEWVVSNFNQTTLLPFPGVTIFTKKPNHLVKELF